MKHFSSFIILIASVILSINVNAKVISVSNDGSNIGQFNSLGDAHDAAMSGDTIYLYPSLQSYHGITITKKIVILGIGFNKVSDESDISKIRDTIRFSGGSEGSIISSLSGTFVIEAHANDIVIQRNMLKSIKIFENIKNILIVNNILRNESCQSNIIELKDNANALIYNNILIGCQNGFWYYSIDDFPKNNVCILIAKNVSVLIKNNVMLGSKSVFGFENSEIYFFNNFISCKYYGGYDTHVFPLVINGNIDNKSTIFIQDEYLSNHFIDQNNLNFHLKAGSTAINAGIDGTDAGIYGGDFPFVDGGYPNIPVIYYLDVPPTGSQKDGINITIKAKTNQ